MRSLQAVLCDMDGTLVDTEPLWQGGKLALAAQFDVPFSVEQTEETVGKSMHYSVQKLREAGVPLPEQEILHFLVGYTIDHVQHGVPWIPGAQDFLARMQTANIPVVLVTQAWAPVAEAVVSASNGAIVAMVTGGDVQHPKPHPEPYLLGAARIGADPTSCIAIEDSPSGVESAEAAGCPVIVVPGIHAVAEHAGRFPVSSIADVGVAMIRQILED